MQYSPNHQSTHNFFYFWCRLCLILHIWKNLFETEKQMIKKYIKGLLIISLGLSGYVHKISYKWETNSILLLLYFVHTLTFMCFVIYSLCFLSFSTPTINDEFHINQSYKEIGLFEVAKLVHEKVVRVHPSCFKNG